MSTIRIYSLGLEPDSPYTATNVSRQEMRQAIFSRLNAASAYQGSVAQWLPFQLKPGYSTDQPVLILLVTDWRTFTRRDYFIAANALALHDTGSVRLLPIMVEPAPEATNQDPWLDRYYRLWDRLKHIGISKPLPTTPDQWGDEILARLHYWNEIPPLTAKDLAKRPTSLFFSYSHVDEKLREELARHLKLLEYTGLIQCWHDRKIVPGEDWSAEIDRNLHTCDLIVMLLSVDFFHSQYCSEIETPIALERHKGKSAQVIPVLLRPVVWSQSPLAALQALPSGARPVTSWDSVDSALVNVCEGILSAALGQTGQPSPAKAIPPSTPETSSRVRVLDVGMPAEVVLDRAAMLVVLIRKQSSGGLAVIVAKDMTYEIEPQDVRSKPVKLHFPLSKSKKPESLDLTIHVKSPDFDPPEQSKSIMLSPNGDSQPYIFMLAAKRTGSVKVLVEILTQEELLVACAVSTTGVSSGSDRSSLIQTGNAVFSRNVSWLPEEAAEAIAQKRYDDAIRALEEALRRAPGDENLEDQLEAVREKRNLQPLKDSMCSEARTAQSGDLAGAIQRLKKAVELDPDHVPLLEELSALEHLVREQEERDRADRLISKAKEELGTQRDADAIATLEGLLKAKISHPELDSLYRSALDRKRNQDAERRHDQVITQVRKLRIDGKYSGALSEIDHAPAELRSNPMLLRLKQELERDTENSRLAIWIGETVDHVLNEAHTSLDAALSTLREAMQKLPGEDCFEALEVDLLRRQIVDKGRFGQETTFLQLPMQQTQNQEFTSPLQQAEKGKAEDDGPIRLVAKRVEELRHAGNLGEAIGQIESQPTRMRQSSLLQQILTKLSAEQNQLQEAEERQRTMKRVHGDSEALTQAINEAERDRAATLVPSSPIQPAIPASAVQPSTAGDFTSAFQTPKPQITLTPTKPLTAKLTAITSPPSSILVSAAPVPSISTQKGPVQELVPAIEGQHLAPSLLVRLSKSKVVWSAAALIFSIGLGFNVWESRSPSGPATVEKPFPQGAGATDYQRIEKTEPAPAVATKPNSAPSSLQQVPKQAVVPPPIRPLPPPVLQNGIPDQPEVPKPVAPSVLSPQLPPPPMYAPTVTESAPPRPAAGPNHSVFLIAVASFQGAIQQALSKKDKECKQNLSEVNAGLLTAYCGTADKVDLVEQGCEVSSSSEDTAKLTCNENLKYHIIGGGTGSLPAKVSFQFSKVPGTTVWRVTKWDRHG